MDHANAAFDLLLCEDAQEAEKLAVALNQSNSDRQRASENLYQNAKRQIGEAGERTILFAIGEGWSVGLAGLVAGKLMQDYCLPVFVLCKQEGNVYAGSGRSLHGFDVTAAMKNAASVLKRFGGHPQACGLSLEGEEALHEFQRLMNEQAAAYFATHDRTPVLSLEAEVPPSLVTWDYLEALAQLEPHGEAHPRSVFKTPPVTVMGLDVMGADRKHLRLTIGEQDHPFFFKCVGFRMSEWMQKLKVGDTIEVAYEVGVNEWNGRKEIQLRLLDIKKLV